MASNYYLKLGFRHALDNVNNLIKPFWLQIGYNNHIDIDRYIFLDGCLNYVMLKS